MKKSNNKLKALALIVLTAIIMPLSKAKADETLTLSNIKKNKIIATHKSHTKLSENIIEIIKIAKLKLIKNLYFEKIGQYEKDNCNNISPAKCYHKFINKGVYKETDFLCNAIAIVNDPKKPKKINEIYFWFNKVSTKCLKEEDVPVGQVLTDCTPPKRCDIRKKIIVRGHPINKNKGITNQYNIKIL